MAVDGNRCAKRVAGHRGQQEGPLNAWASLLWLLGLCSLAQEWQHQQTSCVQGPTQQNSGLGHPSGGT